MQSRGDTFDGNSFVRSEAKSVFPEQLENGQRYAKFVKGVPAADLGRTIS